MPRLPRRHRRNFNDPGHAHELTFSCYRGYDRNILEPSTLLAMIDYLHLNPVRRGLVERAVDWHWSSAAYYECGGHSPLRLDPIPPEWLVTG